MNTDRTFGRVNAPAFSVNSVQTDSVLGRLEYILGESRADSNPSNVENSIS